ncbi:MAG TPA: GNAT family N-acetyltransferase [Polyangiaceae bacterium]
MAEDRSPPVSVPRLRTQRLLLREYRMADFDAFAAHFADPASMEILGVKDRRTAWRIFASNMGGWILQGTGWWAVERLDGGGLVSYVGAFFRETWPEIEIGWGTLREHWGKGYATEAVEEVLRYVFDVRKEKRATALIDAANGRSLRVAEKLGMTYESETELFGEPVGRYVKSP